MLGNQEIYCSVLYRTKCNRGNFQKLEQLYRLRVDYKPVFGNWLSRFPQNQNDPLVMHVYLDKEKEDAHKADGDRLRIVVLVPRASWATREVVTSFLFPHDLCLPFSRIFIPSSHRGFGSRSSTNHSPGVHVYLC